MDGGPSIPCLVSPPVHGVHLGVSVVDEIIARIWMSLTGGTLARHPQVHSMTNLAGKWTSNWGLIRSHFVNTTNFSSRSPFDVSQNSSENSLRISNCPLYHNCEMKRGNKALARKNFNLSSRLKSRMSLFRILSCQRKRIPFPRNSSLNVRVLD